MFSEFKRVCLCVVLKCVVQLEEYVQIIEMLFIFNEEHPNNSWASDFDIIKNTFALETETWIHYKPTKLMQNSKK